MTISYPPSTFEEEEDLTGEEEPERRVRLNEIMMVMNKM